MTKDEIRLVCSKVSIVSYLEARGIQFYGGSKPRANCPLPGHQDDTPSFYVGTRPDGSQTFKCYGCGRWGDVVSLVQAVEGVGFMDAMTILALKAGVNLTTGGEHTRSEPQERDVMRIFTPEDDAVFQIAELCRGHMHVEGYSDASIDNASAVYQKYDELIAKNDLPGIAKLLRQVRELCSVGKDVK
jgi:DNA primase